VRIAWCCKWIPPGGEDPVAEDAMNFRSTTATALAKLAPAEATARLLQLVRPNLAALHAQIGYAAARPPIERALRIGSNILPLYTHPAARPRYDEPALREVVEGGLAAAGRLAKRSGVRLSTHPGQFTVLATVNEAARRNAIEEIEYHTEVMRLMGVAGGWHPDGAHINIHGGAREPGIVSFREGFAMLSEDARGLLTVENDEVSYGLEDLLPLADALPIVLDIHHHWIHSKGEHIRPDDPRVARVAGSWRGTRPVGHASLPRAELLAQIDADGDGMPDFASLVGAGVSTRDLRSHSDLMTGKAQLDWVASHLSWADLEIEAKHKNLATEGFAAWLEAAGHRS